MDTLEVIFARPVGTGEDGWGKVAGTLRVFGVMLAVVLAMTLFLHVAVAKSPFSLAAYVWYPLTLALPCFMFVLGLTLAVNHAVQARALALVVLIGIRGLLYFYLEEAGHGVLDLFGQQVPAMGSDVTGLAEGGMYVLQRGMWFVAGAGLILLSAAAFRRLPNGRGKAGYAVAGSLCLAVAAGMGCGYVGHYRQAEARTAAYGEVYDRYAGKGQVHVAEHRLAVTLAGERLEGRSELAVVNPTGQQMERVVLYLNPGLEVEQVAYCPGLLSNDPIGVGQLVFRCRSRAEKKVGLGLSRWDWFGRLLPGNTRSGNAAIDAVFRVRCSDAELARRIFAREEVAGLLLANPWLLLRVETKWGYITVLLKDLIARMYTGEELASFARCVEAVADELLALYYAR